MLAKAVKIIGRIFFRPGRSVSFFSVDDNGFSFVHDLRNDPRRERGTGSRLFQMREERLKFTCNLERRDFTR